MTEQTKVFLRIGGVVALFLLSVVAIFLYKAVWAKAIWTILACVLGKARTMDTERKTFHFRLRSSTGACSEQKRIKELHIYAETPISRTPSAHILT